MIWDVLLLSWIDYIKSDQFDLPRKLPWGDVNDINGSVVIIGTTETPIEHPK